jgi:thiol-disulfide isomerase/thioredoxin
MFLFCARLVLAKIHRVTEESATVDFNRKGKSPMFVKFWSPWCAECASITPVFEDVSSDSNFNEQILFASFNCHDHPTFCKRHQLQYPSFHFLTNNLADSISHEGANTVKSLSAFLEKQLNLTLMEIPRNTDLTLLVSNFSSAFIFEYPSDNAVSEIASNVSSKFKSTEIRFYRRIGETCSLIAYRSPRKRTEYRGNWTERDVFQFVFNHSLPFVAAFSPVSVRYVVRLRKLGVIAFLNTESEVNELFEWNLIDHPEIQYMYATFQMAQKTLLQLGINNRERKPFFVIVNFTGKVWWKGKGSFNDIELNKLVELATSDKEFKMAEGPGGGSKGTILDRLKFRLGIVIDVDFVVLIGIVGVAGVLGTVLILVWGSSRKMLKVD